MVSNLTESFRVKKCDLASFASIREFCRQVNKEERRVDILVNIIFRADIM